MRWPIITCGVLHLVFRIRNMLSMWIRYMVVCAWPNRIIALDVRRTCFSSAMKSLSNHRRNHHHLMLRVCTTIFPFIATHRLHAMFTILLMHVVHINYSPVNVRSLASQNPCIGSVRRCVKRLQHWRLAHWYRKL